MNIDWKTLAKQKATLVDILANGLLTQTQLDDLQGILHFIDATQDLAAECLENVVFLGEDGYTDADNKRVANSDWIGGPKWRLLIAELINSADDTGCDGLTVIGMDEYEALKSAWNSGVPW